MTITYEKYPKCGGANIVPIVYGEPTYVTHLKSEEGECVLGGCIILIKHLFEIKI